MGGCILNSEKLTARQMLVWIASAMSAPLAIYGGKVSWGWTTITGALCIILALAALRFGSNDFGLVIRLIQLAVLSIVAGAFAREITPCWGEGSGSMPLVLLALAALSAVNSTKQAGQVCCCISWLIAIGYALMLAVGFKNVQWERLTAVRNDGELLIVVYLMPAIWLLAPAQRANGLPLLAMVLFGLAVSILCFGTLSAEGVTDSAVPFYQYSKSLTMMGIAERFEAIASVALTLGLFCSLSLLLNAAERMLKHGALIGSIIAALNVPISGKNITILAVFAWIILPLFCRIKKVKKR